jgi:hypothetical protein
VVPRGYHFSIDDVLKALLEASDRGGDLFAIPFFALLEEAHRRFGTKTDLYLFQKQVIDGRERSLAEVSSRLREVLARTDWIRFGPHALDYGTAPYAQDPASQSATIEGIYREVDRFAGAERHARWVRLHYFSEAYESAPALIAAGVEGLLLTDKEAAAYRLSEDNRSLLRERGEVAHAGLSLYRSHLRVENILDLDRRALAETLDAPIQRYGYLSLFTHEYELDRADVRSRMMLCLEILAERAVPSI